MGQQLARSHSTICLETMILPWAALDLGKDFSSGLRDQGAILHHSLNFKDVLLLAIDLFSLYCGVDVQVHYTNKNKFVFPAPPSSLCSASQRKKIVVDAR